MKVPNHGDIERYRRNTRIGRYLGYGALAVFLVGLIGFAAYSITTDINEDQDFFNRCKAAGGFVITDYYQDESRICVDREARVILQER